MRGGTPPARSSEQTALWREEAGWVEMFGNAAPKKEKKVCRLRMIGFARQHATSCKAIVPVGVIWTQSKFHLSGRPRCGQPGQRSLPSELTHSKTFWLACVGPEIACACICRSKQRLTTFASIPPFGIGEYPTKSMRADTAWPAAEGNVPSFGYEFRVMSVRMSKRFCTETPIREKICPRGALAYE